MVSAGGFLGQFHCVLIIYIGGAKMHCGLRTSHFHMIWQAWLHPESGATLPYCAKAVLLDDVARKTALAKESRAAVSKAVHSLVNCGEFTEESVKTEMQLVDTLFQHRIFLDMPPGQSAEWEKAQLAYLKRVRRRPGGLKRELPQAAAPRLKQPAGGKKFTAAMKLQLAPVTVNGLLAAHEIKRWVVYHGFRMTLGTAGTERHWRNWQRMARNLARSHGEARSAYLVSMQRWLREVQARSACVRVNPASVAAAHTQKFQLALALLHGNVPIDFSRAIDPASIYALYLDGQL